jgi:hypothetical protein
MSHLKTNMFSNLSRMPLLRSLEHRRDDELYTFRSYGAASRVMSSQPAGDMAANLLYRAT